MKVRPTKEQDKEIKKMEEYINNALVQEKLRIILNTQQDIEKLFKKYFSDQSGFD
jgi:uncharacterized protein YehS (DUF1456 family)